jgi:hypothetical protein
MFVTITRVRLAALLAVLSLLGSTTAWAQSEIFQCTDATGKIEYKNTGTTKGCKKMTVDPVIVPRLANSTATGGSFPKVDSATQKSRDSDRRKILEDELGTQKAKLAQLQKDYNNGEPDRQGDERNYQKYLDRVQALKDSIARTQSDVDSIQGELAKLP